MTVPASASLDFMTSYDAEVGSDYGYVEVSTDDGATWTSIPGTSPPRPTPTAEPGQRSQRQLGRMGSCDVRSLGLLGPDGQSSASDSSRTNYINLAGWAVDDIKVNSSNGVLFADDAETLSPEVTPDGWLRVGAYPPAYQPDHGPSTPPAHGSNVANTELGTTGLTCGQCHQADLQAEHTKPSSTSAAARCATCHPTAVAALGGSWNKGCAQGGCHADGSETQMHAHAESAHAPEAANAACLASGCHASTDLSVIHASAETTVGGVARTSCMVCHSDGVPSGKDCVTCHAQAGVDYHANQSSSHIAHGDPSGCSECHSLDLPTEHAKVTSGSITCAGCHGSTEFGALAKPWSGSCSGCHVPHGDLGDTHRAAPASETITILGSGYGKHLCTECHATMDVSTLHGGETACATCHPSAYDTLAPDWGRGCVQGGCHTSGSTKPKHADIDSAHDLGSLTCWDSSCHDGAGDLATLHSTASTTTVSGTLTSCQICHAAGRNASAECASSGCHASMHASLPASLHTSTDGYDFISVGMDNDYHSSSDGEDAYCSGCHTLSMLPLHANNCGVCHSSTASLAVKTAVATGQRGCVTLPPSSALWRQRRARRRVRRQQL